MIQFIISIIIIIKIIIIKIIIIKIIIIISTVYQQVMFIFTLI